MTKGMNSLDPKDRRRQRRRNHIVKDLKTDKYRQQIVPNKRRKKEYYIEEGDED